LSLQSSTPTRYPSRIEPFTHGGFEVDLLLPASSEALIDEREFDADERLPYWAELWPSARALARALLEMPEVPERVLELGCGVGLPSLALRSRGIHPVASDYYPDALEYVAANAVRNGLAPVQTLLLDWRKPNTGLPQFDLVIAADVLYEARNADAIAALLPDLVSPTGRFVLADPGRSYLGLFLDKMKSRGWSASQLPEMFETADGGKGLTRVQLFNVSRPSCHPERM
jgi:predicted nicotinamide N-methyase